MKSGLLFLALAFAWAAACNTASPPDEDCIVNGGGICFTKQDLNGCHTPLTFQCGAGYQCCSVAYAANLVCSGSGNCKVLEAGTGQPDAVADGTAVDTGHDASDAAKDSSSDVSHDVSVDAVHDGATRDAPEDVAADATKG